MGGVWERVLFVCLFVLCCIFDGVSETGKNSSENDYWNIDLTVDEYRDAAPR